MSKNTKSAKSTKSAKQTKAVKSPTKTYTPEEIHVIYQRAALKAHTSTTFQKNRNKEERKQAVRNLADFDKANRAMLARIEKKRNA